MTISTCGSIRIACDTVATRAFDDKRTPAPAALLTEQERGTRESQTQVGTGHVVMLERTHPSNNESTTRFSALADIAPQRRTDTSPELIRQHSGICDASNSRRSR
jgi:hypothetical protein